MAEKGWFAMIRRPLIIAGGAALAAVVAGIVLVVALSAGRSGSGNTEVAIDTPADSGAAPSNEVIKDSGGGTTEGIAVHGHWTIEVREPDGRLAQRRDFENALDLNGQVALIRLLSRQMGTPAWGISLEADVLRSGVDAGPCDDVPDMIGLSCLIREAIAGPGLTSFPAESALQFPTLTVSGASLTSLDLTGTAIATTDGSIDQVKTLICMSLPASLDPAACNNGTYFTAKALDTPVAVSTGQQVYVKVTISFS